MRLRLGLLWLWWRLLRLLERRLGLLWLRLWQRWGSAESWSCAAAANVAAACVDRPREMIRQAQPARRNHDEELGILKGMAF